MAENGSGRKKCGFASMDKDKRREVASKGGRASHAKGTAHEFDSDEARKAGRKGGLSVSRDREHMAEIGRRGGSSRGGGARSAGARTVVMSSEPISIPSGHGLSTDNEKLLAAVH